MYNVMKKQQIIVIHGGDTFETYEEYLSFLTTFEVDLESLRKIGWKKTLGTELGDDYEVFLLQMPNKLNAQYQEWTIWFEKYLPLFNEQIVLVGHSLGGIFLAKHLSENKVAKKILATFLVSAPFDDQDSDFSLASFSLPEDLGLFATQGGAMTLYYSTDDPVVPFADAEKYRTALPEAELKEFTDRGHFTDELFPEIVTDIKAVPCE